MAIQVGGHTPLLQPEQPTPLTRKQTLIISGSRDWHFGIILLELCPGKFEHEDEVSEAGI